MALPWTEQMLQFVGGKITNESTFRDLITSEGTSSQMRVPLHECGTLFTPAARRDKVDESTIL